MATVNLTTISDDHPYAQMEGVGRFYTKSIIIDTDLVNIPSGDTVEAISVPANSLVLMTRFEVLTAEGGTLTVDIGDDADPDGYHDGANANTTTEVVSGPVSLTEGTPNTVTGYSGGKYYSAANTIDILFNNAADRAKIKLTAVIVDFN